MRLILLLTIGLIAYPATGLCAAISEAATPNGPDLSCTGPVHTQAIQLWENEVRDYARGQITVELGQNGDTQALYKIQSQLQPFVEMTRRCGDREQLSELVDVLSPAFSSLQPLPDDAKTLGWVCRGGGCTLANRLLGTEVQLYSSQFLGLLGAVATNIAETIPATQRTPAESAFLVNASTSLATQLDHWLSPAYFQRVAERREMTAADAKDGSSKYFFADRDLWLMTSLADLSELHQARIEPLAAGGEAFKSLKTKQAEIGGLFDLFLARTTLTSGAAGNRAEIDRGYWRNYADSKYAAYSGAESPVACQKNWLGLTQKTFRVETQPSYIDPDLGWDISHARRLVVALDTFARNRGNLASAFGYRNPSFNPKGLQRAYANQIVDVIWNKDTQYPLFSNFWDGKNGWYRAGYNSGVTGDCRPGQAPYSLAWTLPTGGYAQWGAFNNTLRSLAIRLYDLTSSTDVKATAFVSKYYAQLQEPGEGSKKNVNRAVWRLTFLSSIAGI